MSYRAEVVRLAPIEAKLKGEPGVVELEVAVPQGTVRTLGDYIDAKKLTPRSVKIAWSPTGDLVAFIVWGA